MRGGTLVTVMGNGFLSLADTALFRVKFGQMEARMHITHAWRLHHTCIGPALFRALRGQQEATRCPIRPCAPPTLRLAESSASLRRRASPHPRR